MDSREATRFFAAVKTGDVEAVTALLDAQPALVERTDPREYDATPMNLAVSRGDLPMLDLLLAKGGDINKPSAWWAGGFRPIHSALGSGDADLVQEVVKRGAQVDAHAAAGLGDLEQLKQLLDADPKAVHERGGDGQLPLHFAATPEVVTLLLARGAEIDARDLDHGATAAQWAVRSRPGVARALVEAGAELDPVLLTALGDVVRLTDWLDASPGDLDARITNERFPVPGSSASHIYVYSIGNNGTLLHVAARCNQPEMVSPFVDRGLDVDVRGDYDECTPLHVAAWDGSREAAGALIDAGADVTAVSGPTHTTPPLVWAIVNGQERMVAFLVERGAPVTDLERGEARFGREGKFKAWCSAGPEVFDRIGALLD